RKSSRRGRRRTYRDLADLSGSEDGHDPANDDADEDGAAAADEDGGAGGGGGGVLGGGVSAGGDGDGGDGGGASSGSDGEEGAPARRKRRRASDGAREDRRFGALRQGATPADFRGRACGSFWPGCATWVQRASAAAVGVCGKQ
ncbi:hypothetical protein MNEG_15316, partial [Monoraphidium neglectum]